MVCAQVQSLAQGQDEPEDVEAMEGGVVDVVYVVVVCVDCFVDVCAQGRVSL